MIPTNIIFQLKVVEKRPQIIFIPLHPVLFIKNGKFINESISEYY